jgi:aldose 1-epimerase
MSYQVNQSVVDGFQVFTLSDSNSGTLAKVVPELGFNLYSLHFSINGKPTKIISEPPHLADLKKNPSRYGHPILFPFPNRIANGSYTFRGKKFETPVSHGGNAIHGYAHQATWRVKGTESDSESASITGVFQLSKDAPEHLQHWPTDAIIEVNYRLKLNQIVISAKITNPSDHELPWGLGYHTYYNLPIAEAGNTAETLVVVPASRRWQLEKFIPTGLKEALPAEIDLRNGRPLAGLKADDVLTDLEHDADGFVTCKLKDLQAGQDVVIQTDRHFSEMVIFTPSWNNRTIAIEPYTQTTNAINLDANGVNGGLNILESGMSQELKMRIQLQPSA